MAIGTTAAILASSAVAAGTSLASGRAQSRAASRAADVSQQAANDSNATQRYIFDTVRNDTAVQREAGNAATRQLAALMGLNLSSPPNGPGGQPVLTSGRPAGNGTGVGAQSRFGNLEGVPEIGRRMVFGGLYDTANRVEAMPGQPIGESKNALVMPAVPDTGPQINGGPGLAGGEIYPTATGGGGNALNPGQSPTDWLRNTPGYQFNFNEGARALNAGLASQGRLLSGDAAREAVRYGQNYGDRIYNQERNALFSLAGMGQVATNTGASSGANYANQTSNINMQNAQNRASSYQNSANAWTNALGGAAGAGIWALGRL